MTASSEIVKKATALQAMRAVLWSFFGVRSKDEHQADIARLSMKSIIVFGIIGAVMFVLTLLLLVNLITR